MWSSDCFCSIIRWRLQSTIHSGWVDKAGSSTTVPTEKKEKGNLSVYLKPERLADCLGTSEKAALPCCRWRCVQRWHCQDVIFFYRTFHVLSIAVGSEAEEMHVGREALKSASQRHKKISQIACSGFASCCYTVHINNRTCVQFCFIWGMKGYNKMGEGVSPFLSMPPLTVLQQCCQN